MIVLRNIKILIIAIIIAIIFSTIIATVGTNVEHGLLKMGIIEEAAKNFSLASEIATGMIAFPLFVIMFYIVAKY